MAKKHKFEQRYITKSGLKISRSDLISFYSARANLNKQIAKYNDKLAGDKYVYDNGTVTSVSELRKAGVPIDFLITEKKYGIEKIKSKKELDIFVSEATTGATLDYIIDAKLGNYMNNYKSALFKAFQDDTYEIIDMLNDLSPDQRRKLFARYEIFSIRKPYEYKEAFELYSELVAEAIADFEESEEK